MKYDHIVVGAGSGGAVLASRLSEDPNRSVLLIEAGEDFSDLDRLPAELKYLYGPRPTVFESHHLWNFEARTTDEAIPTMVPRGRVTGGTSAINGANFLRGEREDFDLWAEAGNDEWAFEKVLPYFKKTESDEDFDTDYHGKTGPIRCRRFTPDEWGPFQKAFYDACLDYGFPDCPDHNRPDSTGVGPLTFNVVDRVRWSTAIGYLNPARHRVNLTIRPNCLVHGIIFDGNKAEGLLVTSGGEMFTVYGDEIILSAGVIGSPHILTLSGVGPADQLVKLGIPVVQDLPGVGANLRDHMDLDLTWESLAPMRVAEEKCAEGAITLRYTAKGSPWKNDMVVCMNNRMSEMPGLPLDESAESLVGCQLLIYMSLSSGQMTVVSTDPRKAPELDYNYFEEPLDRSRYRDGVRICVDLFKNSAFNGLIGKRLGPSDEILDSDDALDLWLRKNVRTGHHPAGTCKMGSSSDPLAVVDQYAKVHGVEGVRVLDASVMPHSLRANLSANIMAMAERVADFIKEGR